MNSMEIPLPAPPALLHLAASSLTTSLGGEQRCSETPVLTVVVRTFRLSVDISAKQERHSLTTLSLYSRVEALTRAVLVPASNRGVV